MKRISRLFQHRLYDSDLYAHIGRYLLLLGLGVMSFYHYKLQRLIVSTLLMRRLLT